MPSEKPLQRMQYGKYVKDEFESAVFPFDHPFGGEPSFPLYARVYFGPIAFRHRRCDRRSHRYGRPGFGRLAFVLFPDGNKNRGIHAFHLPNAGFGWVALIALGIPIAFFVPLSDLLVVIIGALAISAAAALIYWFLVFPKNLRGTLLAALRLKRPAKKALSQEGQN